MFVPLDGICLERIHKEASLVAGGHTERDIVEGFTDAGLCLTTPSLPGRMLIQLLPVFGDPPFLLSWFPVRPTGKEGNPDWQHHQLVVKVRWFDRVVNLVLKEYSTKNLSLSICRLSLQYQSSKKQYKKTTTTKKKSNGFQQWDF